MVTDQTSPPTYYFGDDHLNTCYGGDGWDSMYGYGSPDTLTGGSGKDKIRGATGDDSLQDRSGTSDEDTFCDGDGYDTIHMGDSDGKDHLHFTGGGYSVASHDFSLGDSVDNHLDGSGCPM